MLLDFVSARWTSRQTLALFKCPSDEIARDASGTFASLLPRSYALNAGAGTGGLYGVSSSLCSSRLSEIPRPSQLIAMGEAKVPSTRRLFCGNTGTVVLYASVPSTPVYTQLASCGGRQLSLCRRSRGASALPGNHRHRIAGVAPRPLDPRSQRLTG